MKKKVITSKVVIPEVANFFFALLITVLPNYTLEELTQDIIQMSVKDDLAPAT